MKNSKHCYSGIGGQAVLEGVMMKNGEKYAVAVRKPNGEIEVGQYTYKEILHNVNKIPFIRGIFNFIDSLILGMKALNYSASFYDDEETEDTKNQTKDNLVSAITLIISFIMAIGIFVVLPYYVSALFEKIIEGKMIITIIEGFLRIGIFLAYISIISLMKDIKRLYQYHGAEHKCINCIETGRELNVENVRESSRFHKRCGTSFICFVLIVSIVIFFFIQSSNPVEKVLLRILLMPVVAGISYEIIRLAGRSDNIIISAISAPGLWIQRITTSEPDDEIIEVAINSVEAVFDWRNYLDQTFGVKA